MKSPIPKKALTLIVFRENLKVVLENSKTIKASKPKKSMF